MKIQRAHYKWESHREINLHEDSIIIAFYFNCRFFLNIVTSLALLIVALGVSNDGTFVDWSGYKMLCSQPSGAGHPPV